MKKFLLIESPPNQSLKILQSMKLFNRFLILALLCFSQFSVLGQGKPIPELVSKPDVPNAEDIKIKLIHPLNTDNTVNSDWQPKSIDFKSVQSSEPSLLVQRDPLTKLPILIKGKLNNGGLQHRGDITAQGMHYLQEIKSYLKIEDPALSFRMTKEQLDPYGHHHIRYSQQYKNIPVYGAEIVLHSDEQAIYMMNGRYFPEPELPSIQPKIIDETAVQISKLAAEKITKFTDIRADQMSFIAHEPVRKKLVIYHPNGNHLDARLCWQIDLIPNLAERLTYFIDAQSGEELYHFSHICKLHSGHCNHDESTLSNSPPPDGRETANATDLSGRTRTIDVYECTGQFYLLDAARPMFSGNENNCNDGDALAVGTILTLDAKNNAPQNDNFDFEIVSSNNNQWNDRSSVSAHYNGGIAYDYFLNTFNRNSINGNGGNILSFVNVGDENGGDMDNAFWNGSAMFYGNGRQAFNRPLAQALDVAGHEMAHGVIQTTANLVYENQPGALNESFADIFGVMIDRDDWQLGEDIVNRSVFPRALRDMEDPHNGGGPNDFFWQPKHMDEFVDLPNTPQGDNGGVHINSGIPNHAFYLFATEIGSDKAEQIYYRALDDYLVRSSQFIDLRNAVLEAASVIHGANSNEVVAAANSFAAVGIGAGQSNDTQQEIEGNPGQDFVLYSDDQLSEIRNATTLGADGGLFSTNNHISRPSVSDDGTIIVYIGQDRSMWEINVDWNTGDIIRETTIEETLNWRNIAISKDGNRVAGVVGDLQNGIFDNRIFVFDFPSGTGQWFELFNPTTAQGISTGDVQFADVLEFDNTGQFLMYDASSIIRGDFGDDIEYWDIGFLEVWDNTSNDFGDGSINKLFTGLSEGTSVGNPTFAKNAPFIIAFDLIEEGFSSNDYKVQAANIETGDIGLIFESNTLGYPNYSTDDDQVIFSFDRNGVTPVVAIRSLQNDKINGTGDANLLINNANWGVWFATGQRDLMTNTEEAKALSQAIDIYPNPAGAFLVLAPKTPLPGKVNIDILRLDGQSINSWQFDHLTNQQRLEIGHLTDGIYLLRFQNGESIFTQKFIKLKN